MEFIVYVLVIALPLGHILVCESPKLHCFFCCCHHTYKSSLSLSNVDTTEKCVVQVHERVSHVCLRHLDNEALGINHPDLLQTLFLSMSLLLHGHRDQLSDPHRCLAGRQNRGRKEVWQVMWWWWNRASFLQSVYQIVSFMSLSLLTEENVMKQYEIQCAIILYSCPQWPLSSRSNCAIHTSPAPWNTMVWSNILLLVMRRAAKSPATATAAVPDGDDRTSDKR